MTDVLRSGQGPTASPASTDPRTNDDSPVRNLVRAGLALAPVLILALFALTTSLIALSAGDTLGYDYDAYVAAARNLLDGRALYEGDLVYAVGHSVFLYPPPFALALIPVALLPAGVALWAWLAIVVGSVLLAIALMPVSAGVRWAVLLLAALSWPALYAIKLGQVSPILLLAFVVGWRWMDRPLALGASMAAGALVKVQPALLFLWAVATRQWRAVGVGVAIATVATAIAALVAGPWTLFDFAAVLLAISKPITTPHNFTAGAIAFQLGAPEGLATLLQGAVMVATLAVAVLAWFRWDRETSFVVTVVASQMLSPVVWDHYAIVLLIPTAFLLARRQWWAAALPIAAWLPAPVYPILFAVGLVAPLVVGGRTDRADRPQSVPAPA